MRIIFLSLLTIILCNTIQATSYSNRTVTPLGKSNFMTVGATTLDKTLTIATPGIYLLTEDIASAVTSNQIININSNNVTVDLNGYTLSGQSDQNMNGIEVASGKNNIEIKNGTLYSMGNAGIKVNASVHNIKISNIICNLCNVNNGATTGGIALVGGSETEIEQCIIDNCITYSIVPQTAHAYGVYATNTNYLTITDSHAKSVRNIGKTYSGIGFHIKNSQYSIIHNSSATLCEGDLIGAGFYLLTCTTAQLAQCTADGNASSPTYAASTVTTGTGAGFYLNDTNNSLLQECNASNNNSGVTAAGFLQESCANNQFITCTAHGQSVSDSTLGMEAAGFRTVRDVTTTKGATQNCLFRDCKAFGQIASTNYSSVAAGFLIGNDTRNSSIIACASFSNNGGTNGTGIGIDLVSTSTNIFIQGCQILNNKSATANKGIGIRDSASNSSSLLIENFAFNNRDSTARSNTANYSVQYVSTNMLDTSNSNTIAALVMPTKKNLSVNPQQS